ncbi:ATP-dependent RNA helicase HrpA [Puniceicoccaceae bacterium K14]|nr:ATP-dependent RNA helicase HrpA [Puniceicoccaceae bacterium K14]
MNNSEKNRNGKTPTLPPWEKSPIAYPEELPISKRRKEIIETIRAHPVVILSGETGSGKTTQIPKMCLEAGLGKRRKIACTQPRRVAAISVAKRVAEELGATFGKEVGCKIRFDDKTSRQTRIKFMTDGMLLSETQGDPSLKEYDTIIIDEAHERSLNIDFILGHLNQLRKRRPDLKVIITSATIDIDKFSKAFDDAPIIEVSGRLYPVDIIYAPLEELLEGFDESSYIDGVIEAVDRITSEHISGDILAFFPTEKDIREAMEILSGRHGKKLSVLPCYGRLSSSDQQQIFSSSKQRKLVLATNIAETSLTIPGIQFVIDTGLARLSRYNPRNRTKRLPIEKISQSSANQRSGRCGRMEDGICIRLYSENDFISRPEYSVPEIQRSNLAEVILKMKASQLGDVETFPFIDPPSAAAIKSGYMLLYELGALNDTHDLTTMGRRLSFLPVDPTVGRMLIQSEKENVVESVLVISSALSIQDPRERPLGKEEAARAAHKPFIHKQSDFLTLLNIWERYHEKFESMTQGKLRRFCKEHFLSYLRMREWKDTYDQLKRSLSEYERKQRTHSSQFVYESESEKCESRSFAGAEYAAIHHCLLTGLLANPGRKLEPNTYQATGNRKILIFPGSGLFNHNANQKKKKAATPTANKKAFAPEWIVCSEIVETNRLYARTVAAIDPQWILEFGEHVIKRSYSQPIWDEQSGRVFARESVRIHGMELKNQSVSYLKVDPPAATEIFIREALLGETFEAPHPFLTKNRQLMQRLQNMQTTIQISSWIGTEEAAYQFYADRIKNVASVHDLNRLLKKRGGMNSDYLLMEESDLTSKMNDEVNLEEFPKEVNLQNSVIPIEYFYKPGDERDGITLKVPYSKTTDLDAPILDWLVPGHLQPKIEYLLRSLPKDIRRKLSPISDYSRKIASRLKPTGNSLAESLAEHLRREYSIETYHSDWNAEAIPNHLKVRVQVLDTKGKTVATARDLESLKKTLAEKEERQLQKESSNTAPLFEEAKRKFEQREINLRTLKKRDRKIEIGKRNGVPVFAFFGLREMDDSIGLRLFKNEDEAKHSTIKSISRLIANELKYELAWIQKDLKELKRLGPIALTLGSIDQIQKDTLEMIRSHLCQHQLKEIDPSAIQAQCELAKQVSKGILFRVIDALRAILEKRQKLTVGKTKLPKELQQEVVRLTPKNFLQTTPFDSLLHIERYLTAIEKRAIKRIQNPKRDAQWAREIKSLRDRYKQITNSTKHSNSQEVKWMIEEFTVSLFAQELGTRYPISGKRIEKKIENITGLKSEVSPSRGTSSPSKKVEPIQPDRPTSKDLESLKNLFS